MVLPLIDTLAQNGDRFGIKNYYKERRIVVNINRSRVNFFPFFQICFSSTMTSIYFSHHSVSLVTELLDVSSEIVSISGGKELWHAWFFDYQNGIEEFFLQKQNIVNINLLASICGMDYSFYVIDLYTPVMDVFETISISDDEELWHCKHTWFSGWSNCIKAFSRCPVFFFFFSSSKKEN